MIKLTRLFPVLLAIILMSTSLPVLFARGASEIIPDKDNTSKKNPGSEEFGLTKKELVQVIEDVERYIAQYMREAGFEYIPNDYNTIRRGMQADKSLPGMHEYQFIHTYGFGISTLYTGLPPQLAEKMVPGKIGLGNQNIQIFKNLSPADQQAYNYTLLGENWEATFAVALETEDFSRVGGATKWAIQQVFSPEMLNPSYYNPMDAMIEEDPRMIEAMAKFAELMQNAGFNYTHEKDVEPDIRDRLWKITKGKPVSELSPEARKALEELQAYEMAVAKLMYEAEVKILDPVESEVSLDLFGRD